MSEVLDFKKYFAQRDAESKAKASLDDMFIFLMQSEHKRLEQKIDISVIRLEEKIIGVDLKIDGVEKRLDAKIDGVETRLVSKIDQVLSMKKWVVGIFVTIMLGFAMLAAPGIISLI